MYLYRVVVSIILILYGIFKIAIVSGTVFVPVKYHTGVFARFLKNDFTIAGMMLDLVLFIFGCYTIVHGVALLELIPKHISKIFNSRKVNRLVYTLFGIFLIAFYTLVLNTTLIPQEPEAGRTYELVGIGGGILFLMGATALGIWICIDSGYRNLYAWIIAFLVLLAAFIMNAFITIRKHRKTNNSSIANDIISLLMIPLGTVG